MIPERMLELLILHNLLDMVEMIRSDKFEVAGNLYSITAIRDRYKELLIEFIEPYMAAQNAEVVDITEKSE